MSASLSSLSRPLQTQRFSKLGAIVSRYSSAALALMLGAQLATVPVVAHAAGDAAKEDRWYLTGMANYSFFDKDRDRGRKNLWGYFGAIGKPVAQNLNLELPG